MEEAGKDFAAAHTNLPCSLEITSIEKILSSATSPTLASKEEDEIVVAEFIQNRPQAETLVNFARQEKKYM
jgi:hypothetical protein